MVNKKELKHEALNYYFTLFLLWYSRAIEVVDEDFHKEYSEDMKQKTSQELMKEFDAKAEEIIKKMQEISRRSEKRRMMLLNNKQYAAT